MAMSKAELQKAFREAASLEFAEIPRDDMQIQYEFSAAFEVKMERLLQKEKKFTWRLVNTAAKRAAVAIAVCMVLILTACSVPAIREPIIEFIIEVFDIDMDYTFDDNNSPDIITTEYHLSVIPSGFSKVSEDRIEGYIRVDYEAENGSTLYLMQTTGSTTTTVDTEKTKYKILDIDGREVHFHVREYDNPEDTIMVAVWIENSCFFKVCTHGITDEQTVIEIISNVKPIE